MKYSFVKNLPVRNIEFNSVQYKCFSYQLFKLKWPQKWQHQIRNDKENLMIDYLIANKSIIELLILSSIGLTSFVFILMVAIKKINYLLSTWSHRIFWE